MHMIAPSLLEADQTRLGDELEIIRRAGAKYVHIDIMDGCYVPNLFGGIAWLNSIRKASDLTFDVHLMVREPGRFLIDMKKAGADVLTVHYEACRDVKSVLRQIKDLGAKSGIALNPETRVDILDEELLTYADVVHLMCTRPGVGGGFRQDSIDRIRRVKELLKDMELERDIEADGGINFENVREVAAAGANIIVSGKALFRGDLEENIRRMRMETD